MSINYNTVKTDELTAMILEREIETDDKTRAGMIKALKLHDVQTGAGDETLELDEEGRVKALEAKLGIKLRKVIFHNVRQDEAPYVFIGHNGKAFYIPTEKEVYVPDYLLTSVIKDAVEDRMEPVKMGDKIEWVTKKYRRFPYSLVE
jgi:hypothetical protein